MEPPEKVNNSVSRVGVTCEQALQLGKSREVTREQHAKGDASARGTFSRGSSHSLQMESYRTVLGDEV